ncbi:MAG: hypothetical protein K2O24_07370 [Muribaculaceae bacterium]|nr:hypothetical protein [Muribaculaceae bacterium]
MKKYIIGKIILYAFLLLILGVAVTAGYRYLSKEFRKPPVTTVRPAVVKDVKTMARLCTVDIYSELPVLDTINGKVIMAVQKQRGSVSFDLEKLHVDSSGDTVRFCLPPEIVELYEATDDDAYEVIDTKSLSMFRSGTLTNAEDNTVKRRLHARSLERLYKDGVIANARKEGRQQMARLFSAFYRKPVLVTDSTPRGASRVSAQ